MSDSSEILKKVANLRSVKGDLVGAIKLLESELLEFPVTDQAKAYQALGILYSDIGRNEESKDSLNKSITLAKKFGDMLTEADATRRLGYVIWTTEGNEIEALRLARLAQAAIKSKAETKYQKIQASIFALIGNIHFDLGRYNLAREAYQEGLKLAKTSGYVERESTILGDLGNLALAQKQFSQALNYLNQAKKIAETKYRHELPAALLRIGKVYFDPDNPDHDLAKAEKYFRQVIEICQKEGWIKDEAEAYQELSKLYAARSAEIYRAAGIAQSRKARS